MTSLAVQLTTLSHSLSLTTLYTNSSLCLYGFNKGFSYRLICAFEKYNYFSLHRVHKLLYFNLVLVAHRYRLSITIGRDQSGPWGWH